MKLPRPSFLLFRPAYADVGEENAEEQQPPHDIPDVQRPRRSHEDDSADQHQAQRSLKALGWYASRRQIPVAL